MPVTNLFTDAFKSKSSSGEKAHRVRVKVEENPSGGFRNILALGLVSFFTDASSEMCFGLLPSFILSELGGTVGVLGLIEGLAESLSYILRVISGALSDRFRRRKPLVFAGYCLSAVVKPFFAAAQSWVDVLAVRLGDRVGKGVRTAPRDALLSESIGEKRIGAAFGLHRTLDQLGAIVGPILASGLIVFFSLSIREVFLFSLIPGLAAVAVLATFVREVAGQPVKRRFLSDLGRVLKGRFPLLLVVVGVFSAGAFNFSFILVKAGELGVTEALLPLVYGVINIAHTLSAIPAGLLSDRFGREKVLVAGYGVFLTSTLMLLLHGSPLYGFLIAFVYGVYVGVIETIQRAVVPSYVPGELRGTGYGLYYLVAGSSFLIANTLVGFLWERIGIEAVTAYSTATTVSAIVGMTFLARRSRS
ncbi:MFS transporter [Candidatus Bathyarchaeota archaeon]|nr:MAG: MFS transporter [Candidatus Bathyarchaeota archaeon]